MCKVFAVFKTFSSLNFGKRWSLLYNAFAINYSFFFRTFVYVFLSSTVTELNQVANTHFLLWAKPSHYKAVSRLLQSLIPTVHMT